MNPFPQLFNRLPFHAIWSKLVRHIVWLSLLIALSTVAACSRIPFFSEAPEESVVVPVTIGQSVAESDSPAIESASISASLQAMQGKILFKSNRSGEEQLYVMNADGSDQQLFDQSLLYSEAAKLESFSSSRTHQIVVQRFGDGQYLFDRELETEVKRQLTGGPWSYYSPAWSPAGQRIAYVAEIEGRPFVNLFNLETDQTSILLPPSIGRSKHPSWSPDGNRLALAVEDEDHRQIWVATADGTQYRNVSNNAFRDRDPIWIKPPWDGGETAEPEMSDNDDELSLSWSKDRCLVRVEAVDRQDGRVPIEHVKILTSDALVFDSGPISTRDFRETRVLNLTPGAHMVELQVSNAGKYQDAPFVLRDTLFCLSEEPVETPTPTPDTFVIEPTPEPRNIFDAATRVAQTAQGQSALPFGAVVATSTPQPLVITSTPTPLNEATREFERAFATAMAATTGTPTPIPAWWITATPTPTDTATPLPTFTPVTVPWAPRGVPQTPQPTPTQPFPEVLRGKILFRSNRDDRSDIYAINPDGSDIQKLTASWPYEQALAQDVVSSDGTYRVFVNTDASAYQIFYYDADYDVARQVSFLGAGDAWDPAIEPGGWRVAFVSNEAQNDELYVVNRDGSDLRRLTNNEWEWDRHPSWSPDGSEIVFWSNRSGRKQLYIISPDGSNLRLLSDGFADDWDPVWVK